MFETRQSRYHEKSGAVETVPGNSEILDHRLGL